ncbi:12854_t:CDS:2 [Rhizophagus irregularis]|nr:12854_t:CDS:2 [Rhizophagus irregularis]
MTRNNKKHNCSSNYDRSRSRSSNIERRNDSHSSSYSGVEVAQEIMSEEEKIHDTKKLKMIKTVSNDNQSHNKNKNEGKDLAVLEEEV